jgi:hypothetical protein
MKLRAGDELRGKKDTKVAVRLVERIPQEMWDKKKDPEWVLELIGRGGPGISVRPESSITAEFKITG